MHCCKTWRHYLAGAPFRVLTDHQTLKHITTQPSLSRRQLRYLEELSDFSFEVEYIKGRQISLQTHCPGSLVAPMR